jgi:anti-sigma factor RsiW
MTTFLEHSHFEELCMSAAVGQISAAEFQELSDHMRECDSCRDSYADFVRLTHEQLPLVPAAQASASEPAGIFDKIAAKRYKARFAARARERGLDILPARFPPASLTNSAPPRSL